MKSPAVFIQWNTYGDFLHQQSRQLSWPQQLSLLRKSLKHIVYSLDSPLRAKFEVPLCYIQHELVAEAVTYSTKVKAKRHRLEEVNPCVLISKFPLYAVLSNDCLSFCICALTSLSNSYKETPAVPTVFVRGSLHVSCFSKVYSGRFRISILLKSPPDVYVKRCLLFVLFIN